jgi:hypothetical protein
MATQHSIFRRVLPLLTSILVLSGSVITYLQAEELPDQAVWDEEQDSMKDRFPKPPLDSEEMGSMYLESPSLAENQEDQKGGKAIQDEQRFSETDLFQRERYQEQRIIPPPEINRPPAALPGTGSPIQDL